MGVRMGAEKKMQAVAARRAACGARITLQAVLALHPLVGA